MSLRSIPLAAIAALVLPWLLTGCSPEAAPPAESPRVVEAHVIQPDSGAAATRLTGRVRAAERSTLSFELPGRLARLEVEAGDRIRAGEPLARLEDERYRLVAEQRRAELREAEALLEEKRQDYRRHARLAERDYVSATRLDSVRAALASAESRQASAAAALALAERDLALTTLTAPFDGSVGARRAEPGERVTANQPILEVISDRQGFEVETRVPETLVGALAVGSRHVVTLPALGDRELVATLRHLGTQPRSSNDYPLILSLASPPPGLRSGMTAQVALTPRRADAEAGLPVPLTALVYDDNGAAHVLRIEDQARLTRVAVEVIDLGDGWARVRGDLAPGQRLVARGAEFVRDGQRVSLLGEGPERYH
ncbi:efflux RND transporter periplasmic adaptor subunit [Halomonas sp. NCCP-2165]|nr:efflux RND transporter periplasmic adaptor subunit [Halomonas sp. NCCP-2165]GKW48179.1 hemolysin D [Halomonas sp. NCCP-2165]